MQSGTVSSVPVLPHEVGTTTGTSIGCCGRTGWRLTQLSECLTNASGMPGRHGRVRIGHESSPLRQVRCPPFVSAT